MKARPTVVPSVQDSRRIPRNDDALPVPAGSIWSACRASSGELPEAWAETEWSQRLADSTWDPHGFVDLVQQVERAGSSGRSFCEKIAWLEWQLLFQHCYEQAYAPQP
jgi:hypothetical protein